ncbi:MAG: laminin G domain-containing protein [Saprospirales bacterium]|nr:laminin G domain-containing protein [Saprospirales bacterium]
MAGLHGQVPVAYYPFSGNAKDATAFANHASVNGALFTQDQFGWSNSAIVFDGVQGSVRADNAAQLNTPNATISFWVNVNALPGTGEAFLISFGGWQERYKISLPPHGKPVFTTNNSSGISDMDSGAGNELQVGVWTHVVAVHDGAKDKIYLDGVLAAEKVVVGTLNSTTHPLGIGYDPIDNANYFNGSIDEVLILDAALSDLQVAALYTFQSAAPVVPPGKVASYSFNNNGADDTEFNNHADVSTASSATDRFGYGKSALLFDGTTTEVTAPNAAQLNSPYTTVSFWVKVNALPATGESFLLSFGGWQERWKISLPPHGKPVWTTNHSGGISGHGLRRE